MAGKGGFLVSAKVSLTAAMIRSERKCAEMIGFDASAARCGVLRSTTRPASRTASSLRAPEQASAQEIEHQPGKGFGLFLDRHVIAALEDAQPRIW